MRPLAEARGVSSYPTWGAKSSNSKLDSNSASDPCRTDRLTAAPVPEDHSFQLAVCFVSGSRNWLSWTWVRNMSVPHGGSILTPNAVRMSLESKPEKARTTSAGSKHEPLLRRNCFARMRPLLHPPWRILEAAFERTTVCLRLH